MPSTETSNVTLDVEMPKGTRIEITEAVVKEMEAIIQKELVGIQTLSSSVGGSGFTSSNSPYKPCKQLCYKSE